MRIRSKQAQPRPATVRPTSSGPIWRRAASVRCTRRTRTLLLGSPEGPGDGGGKEAASSGVHVVRHFSIFSFFFLEERKIAAVAAAAAAAAASAAVLLSREAESRRGWLQEQPRVVVLECIHCWRVQHFLLAIERVTGHLQVQLALLFFFFTPHIYV